MPKRLRPYLRRHEPVSGTLLHNLKSGLGGLAGIAAAGGLATMTELPFLFAPFGASAVLLFGQPTSALAQPANVVGGYAVGAFATAAIAMALPPSVLAAAVGVGLAIAVMLLLRVTHPPAGALPILVATSAIDARTLIEISIMGSVAMVAIAAMHHRIPPRQEYPRRIED
jgi:CBS-domain-containing membrane protein